jgi:hypothetical protein
MAYGDFTLELIEEKFGLINRVEPLFNEHIEPFEPSETLKTTLADALEMPLRTEKSKSEWIVVPILKELWKRNDNFFTIYSGENLNADEANGLKGECDFIIAKDVDSYSISYPIIQIVEAKMHDIEIGVPQCAAQMLGAKIFNEKRGVKLEKIYGCVTTGNEWRFLCLDERIRVDKRTFYLVEIELVLAVFQQIIDYYKQRLN